MEDKLLESFLCLEKNYKYGNIIVHLFLGLVGVGSGGVRGGLFLLLFIRQFVGVVVALFLGLLPFPYVLGYLKLRSWLLGDVVGLDVVL